MMGRFNTNGRWRTLGDLRCKNVIDTDGEYYIGYIAGQVGTNNSKKHHLFLSFLL